MEQAKTHRLNIALHYSQASAQHVQEAIAKIQQSFHEPFRVFSGCRQELDALIRKLTQDLAACKTKEKNCTDQLKELDKERNINNSRALQIQMLASQAHLQIHMLMAYNQNIQAVSFLAFKEKSRDSCRWWQRI